MRMTHPRRPMWVVAGFVVAVIATLVLMWLIVIWVR
jgi:hypothetical protein